MLHFHMLLAICVIQFFCFQCYIALFTEQVQPKTRTMISHSMYVVMMISGLIMIYPYIGSHGFQWQWVASKAVLLVTVMSSSVKAFRPTSSVAQRKAGILIAGIGLVGILILAFVQPDNFM